MKEYIVNRSYNTLYKLLYRDYNLIRIYQSGIFYVGIKEVNEKSELTLCHNIILYKYRVYYQSLRSSSIDPLCPDNYLRWVWFNYLSFQNQMTIQVYQYCHSEGVHCNCV